MPFISSCENLGSIYDIVDTYFTKTLQFTFWYFNKESQVLVIDKQDKKFLDLLQRLVDSF